ncbi:MAG: SCO family protein [Halieaceae bacterium]|nr:SCO family protein [Halieaceae bacterium]
MKKSSANSGIVARRIVVVFLVVTALALSVTMAIRLSNKNAVRQLPEALVEYLMWEPQQLTQFTLSDFDEQVLDLGHLKGKWTFLFFGYTFCPDVCPVTMSNLGAVFKKLEGQGTSMSGLQGLFISVDPARDTPEVLKQYVQFFDQRFMGATGTKAQLDAFTRQVGALYFVDKETADENYQVGHNSSLFLIDPQARLYARFSMPHEPQEISDAFTQIKQFYVQSEH